MSVLRWGQEIGEKSQRAPELAASRIDFGLWEVGQAKSPGDKPYHRTLTTAY